MSINSKNKGNSFERKIAKILSERFAETTGVSSSFRRNADSGSYFGGKNKIRTETHDLSKATMGDLVCPTNFVFAIECKHYKDGPSFLSLLKQDNKTLDKWLEQAGQDAVNSGKHALVVAKFNNIPEMVMISTEIWKTPTPLQYRGYAIILLEEFLTTEDTFFFD